VEEPLFPDGGGFLQNLVAEDGEALDVLF